MSICTACSGADRPLVGAIRWDAWTGGRVTEQVERTLGPQKYHDRLPWFAEVVDDATVKIDGGHQSVMNREIEFAANAGLDYWAFLLYPKGDPMSSALGQYLENPKRKQIRFCLILHNALKVPEDKWPAELERAIGLLEEEGYQNVLSNRPLVYAFTGSDFAFGRFREFLSAARGKGLNPYCVYMGWNPTRDFNKVKSEGFDAVSAYAMDGDQPALAGLVESVRNRYWRNAASSGTPYVPLVTMGWDKRPRIDHPVSWEMGHNYHCQEVFPSRAAPSEITDHVREALSFVQGQPKICQANTIIIYAWNEYDEGGWLAPTRGRDGEPDHSRLDAIRLALKSEENTQPTPAGDALKAVPES